MTKPECVQHKAVATSDGQTALYCLRAHASKAKSVETDQSVMHNGLISDKVCQTQKHSHVVTLDLATLFPHLLATTSI